MSSSKPDAVRIREFVERAWRAERIEKSPIIRGLEAFIAIPNLSPAYERDWAESGHADAAAELLARVVEDLKEYWSGHNIKSDDIKGEIVGGRDNPVFDEGGARRTPALLVEIPAFGGYAMTDTILVYGHMDKQPEMKPWSMGLAPRKPVIKNGRLYGRGSADDGYALFSALTAMAALRAQGIPHARTFVLIEGREESDGTDIAWYLHVLKKRLGAVSFVLCLDSGAGDYERLWITTSLRGLVGGTLRVETLSGAVHSGSASGIVPSPFRIMRALLSRLESESSGVIRLKALYVPIPKRVRREAEKAASALGEKIYSCFPFCEEVRPVAENCATLLLNRTWRPQLSITGISGMPVSEKAGNVTLPWVQAKLSLRLPPPLDGKKAIVLLKKLLEQNPPYNARVNFSPDSIMAGWHAPKIESLLYQAVQSASRIFFGKEAVNYGEGGSIDVMRVFGKAYPKANMLVTGVLGPNSNAHGPDESLHLGMARGLTMCLVYIIAAHARRGV